MLRVSDRDNMLNTAVGNTECIGAHPFMLEFGKLN